MPLIRRFVPPPFAIDPALVHVGHRYRAEYGDLASLAASIDEIGLLHPIVIRTDRQLIAGARRLKAWPQAKAGQAGQPIPCRILDLAAIVRGEVEENMQRLDFTPSEAVAIAEALRPLEEEAARERKWSGKKAPGNLPAGDVRDIVAHKVGFSGRTLDKATAIVRAVEAEPERFAKIKADMDRTGRVNAHYKRLRVRQKADAIRAEPPPFPNHGPYRVIVADPPWPYEVRMEDPTRRGLVSYSTMAIADICGLGPKVRALAHEDCVLWLWSTNHHLRQAYTVLDAWGFAEKTILTWAKLRFGQGDWLRGQTEHCILAVRGNPTVVLTNGSTLLEASVGRHSEKPQAFYYLVERLCPAPRYFELFSRKGRPNWDGFGDEAAAAE